MILLMLATALADIPGSDRVRFEACTSLIRSEPERAIAEADAWVKRDGGVPAGQCLGLAYAALERWQPAAAAFAAGAASAESRQDSRAATLWTLAGNAALAADDPVNARTNLDHALASPALGGPLRGETLLDRARADLALDDLSTARIDIDKARDFAASDPFTWLLSATIARRQKDLPRAEKDIAEALRLAPNEASVALESGNIAAAGGAADAARTAWERTVRLAPDEPEGKAAAAALAANR